MTAGLPIDHLMFVYLKPSQMRWFFLLSRSEEVTNVRVVPITDYNPSSMQLAQPVYDHKRRVLLAAGVTINPKYLDKLIELGIKQLVVEDLESTGITLEEMMDMPTWLDIVQIVQTAYESVATKKPIDVKRIQSAVGQLLMEVLRRQAIMLIPTNSVSKEMQDYAHTVNVALLSMQIGKKMGYNDLQLRDLCIGALLHDIGKAITLDQDHAERGFTILRNVREFSLISAHIAFQHHETFDGQGYPRGIGGAEILEAAAICGVANFYENLISERNLPPHEAVEYLMACADSKFSTPIVHAFVNAIPCYTPGTIVYIDNQEKAIVTRITTHLQRPIVRILTTGKEISLADNPTVMMSSYSGG